MLWMGNVLMPIRIRIRLSFDPDPGSGSYLKPYTSCKILFDLFTAMSVYIKFINSTKLFEHLIEKFLPRYRGMLCIHKLCEIVFFQTRSRPWNLCWRYLGFPRFISQSALAKWIVTDPETSPLYWLRVTFNVPEWFGVSWFSLYKSLIGFLAAW